MRRLMKRLQEIEKLNNFQRWTLGLVTAVLAALVCYWVARKNGNLFSALFVYYIPLGLSAMLLELNITATFTLIVLVLAFLNLLASSFSAWAFTVFFSGLVF